MSVKVTVTTHRWPALVTMAEHAEGDDGAESNVADTMIPADTSQTFNIGHLAHLNIREVDPGALGPTDQGEPHDLERDDATGNVAAGFAAASTVESTKATDADGSLAPGAEEGNV